MRVLEEQITIGPSGDNPTRLAGEAGARPSLERPDDLTQKNDSRKASNKI